MIRIALRCGRTSTSLMRLPTTSFSRSRRITSTSGSSTLSVLLHQLGCVVDGSLVGPARRPLLGLLLRPAGPPARLSPGEVHGRRELLRVIRPTLVDAVLRQPAQTL